MASADLLDPPLDHSVVMLWRITSSRIDAQADQGLHGWLLVPDGSPGSWRPPRSRASAPSSSSPRHPLRRLVLPFGRIADDRIEYLRAMRALEFHRAAPAGTERLTYETGHDRCLAQIRADRRAFLAKELGFHGVKTAPLSAP